MTEMQQPAAPNIEIVHPLGQAWDHMKSALFPFDFKAWISLGFLSWLLVISLGSFNPPQVPFLSKKLHIVPPTVPEMVQWSDSHESLMRILVPVGIAMAFLSTILFAYLRSRAIFAYMDNVYKRRADIVEPWGKTREMAHSFFIWRVCLSLIQLCVVLALATIPYLTFRDQIGGADLAPKIIIKILLVALAAFPILLLMGIAGWILDGLVAPIMYMRNAMIPAAWSLLRNMFRQHSGAFFVYLLMNIAVGMAIGALSAITALCICCVGALPVVHQTILQPFLYWSRAYPFFFIAQFGPEFVAPAGDDRGASEPAQTIPAPQAPAAMETPARIGTCPRCGQQHAIPGGQPGTYSCVRCGGKFEVI